MELTQCLGKLIKSNGKLWLLILGFSIQVLFFESCKKYTYLEFDNILWRLSLVDTNYVVTKVEISYYGSGKRYTLEADSVSVASSILFIRNNNDGYQRKGDSIFFLNGNELEIDVIARHKETMDYISFGTKFGNEFKEIRKLQNTGLLLP